MSEQETAASKIPDLPKGHKVDIETAESEFARWAEGMDLDFDTSGMDAEDLTAFSENKKKIVVAIQKGHLTVNGDDEVVYTPWRKKSKVHDPLTFGEGAFSDLMAMDKKKNGQDVHKTAAVIASVCSVPVSTIAGLAGADRKLVSSVFALLMA